METFATSTIDRLADELLSQIELEEVGLLNWGFIETRTERESFQHFAEHLPDHLKPTWDEARSAGVSIDALVLNLEERRLLFKSDSYYRTRFAEAVRLLALLRQRFTLQDWNTAPRLVSDFKAFLPRRRFPRRDTPASDLFERLKKHRVNDQRIAAVKELLRGTDGAELQLAVFQRDAIIQILRDLSQRRDRGLAIGAGTGAGKTKAFYVPALAETAATMSDHRWTQAIAVYPRTELLKDQFLEAYTEARKLDGFLRSKGTRRIATGAYYGDTPYGAASFIRDPDRFWNYKSEHDSWECPFLRCPNPDCTAPNLIWRKSLIEREVTNNKRRIYGAYSILECPECRYETYPGAIALTRDHMAAEPPDILFTTTEMLNRRLSRIDEHPLFGIGVAQPPRLLLLDEIHTYDGITGAQVAYVLRRWRHARGRHVSSSLCIVGLSATLTNAEEFLTQLTGLPPGNVTYIQPRESELVHEGIEYNLVLKGDPVSGTSLLSTTVQTAMLLGRILDPLRSSMANGGAPAISRGSYGRKIFGFTDKLDVINRWHHIELDAENKQRLSKLRLPTSDQSPTERQQQRAHGQAWAMSQAIGHDLQAPLRVDLVSSQHRGVKSDAELVIATSTLEVGFNDLEVGAILQHKAPRSMASFLQRKGRAGRTRHMRPWTIVVTSAYGRDRWAFQHAEQLFDPILPPINLPLDNYYVQKIQATFALMDWLALQLGKAGFSEADSWHLLDARQRQYPSTLQQQRKFAAAILLAVLPGQRESEMTSHIRSALDIKDDPLALQTVLWDDPRSLMLEVIPTLVRQLETSWTKVEDSKSKQWQDAVSAGPLPEFVTSNLFSDLNTPELLITIPHLKRNEQVEIEESELALTLGMVEFAPGHVNKRYARPWDQKEAHWLTLPDQGELSRGKLSLDQLNLVTDEVPVVSKFEEESVRVFRPRHYRLDRVPDNVRATSSARLIWKWQASIPDRCAPATSIHLSPHSPWHELINEITSYTHRNQSWVSMTRAAVGVNVDIRTTGGQQFKAELDFEDGHQPAALGFASNVDALRFRVNPIDLKKLVEEPGWSQLYQHLGPLYFRYKLDNDARLTTAGLSTFEIGWLWQLELSMIVAIAVSRQCSLPEAVEEVNSNRERLAERTLEVIFQTIRLADEVEQDEHGRLYDKLRTRMTDPVVVAVLEECARALWDPDVEPLGDWLQRCYISTLGHVLFAAITRLVPEVEPDDLHLDIDDSTIWITELTAGGVGHIGRIADLIAHQPRLIDAQLRDVLTNCDRAALATDLSIVAQELSQEPSTLYSMFADARTANTVREQDMSRRRLIAALNELGITGTRELIVSMNDKFLRANSGTDTDELLAHLTDFWRSEESRLGCDIDLRVISVASARSPEIEDRVRAVLVRIDPSAQVSEYQVFNLLQSLLWLDCKNACPDCIEKWFPFGQSTPPSRALLGHLIQLDQNSVSYGNDDWHEQARELLKQEFSVTITATTQRVAQCQRDITAFIMEPIDTGYQFLYPSIQGLRRTDGGWSIDIVLLDVIERHVGAFLE